MVFILAKRIEERGDENGGDSFPLAGSRPEGVAGQFKCGKEHVYPPRIG